MQIQPTRAGRAVAFTLMEVALSVAIMGLVFAGLISAYVQASNRAEWSGYSLAAQAIAVQQMEQFRTATWDTQSVPPIDQITNIPTSNYTNMDIPISGTNVVWVTNNITVTQFQVTTNPVSYLKMIQVDTIWPWRRTNFFTNTMVTYRAPDQ